MLTTLDGMARTDYNRTLQLCDSLLALAPPPEKEGILYRLRGKALYFSGDFDAAGQQFARSVNRLEAAHHEAQLGLTLIEQAKLFRKLKMYVEAEGVYRRAESIFTRLKDSLNVSSVWNEWGNNYQLAGQYPQALRLYRKSLAMKEQLSDTIGIAYAHSFISTAELALEHYPEAETHGLYALRLFEYLADPFAVALEWSNLSKVFQQKEDFTQALFYLHQSDSLATLWNYKDLRAENLTSRAQIFAGKGDYDSAFYFQRALGLLRDSLFTENAQQTIAELNARYELAQKDAALQKQEKEKTRSTYAALFAGFLLFFLGVASFFAIRHQRLRNRALVKEHFYKEELARNESEKRLAEQRNNISRELHDNIGSYLTFIASSIDRIESPQLRSHSKIRAVKELTQETIVELRKTVWLLNRPSLTIFDWQVKLQEYYRRFEEITIRATSATETVAINSEQATQLFRVVQEAINNALKYADATHIGVAVALAANRLQITISDNGKGFDFQTESTGFGMSTMRQRTEALGGYFMLESTPGLGTTVRLTLPFSSAPLPVETA